MKRLVNIKKYRHKKKLYKILQNKRRKWNRFAKNDPLLKKLFCSTYMYKIDERQIGNILPTVCFVLKNLF